MLKTVTVIAAALGAIFTAALGLVAMPFLLRIQRAHRRFVAQQSNQRPAEDQAPQKTADVPALGGCVLWIGCCAALIFAWSLAVATLTENGYADGWSQVALLISGSLPFGLVGMAQDCNRIFHRDGRGMRPAVLLVLEFAAAAAMLALLYYAGNISTLVHLFGRWVDFGVWYWPTSAALMVCIARCAAAGSQTDGFTAGSGFVAALAFLIIGMLMLETDSPGSRFVTALYGAALAGGCIGFLVWNYYPAKIAIGSAGAQFLAAALAMVAWNLGRPELLLLCVLPWLANAFVRVLCWLPLRCNACCADFLLKKHGWTAPAITALGCGVACLGALLSVLRVWFAS